MANNVVKELRNLVFKKLVSKHNLLGSSVSNTEITVLPVHLGSLLLNVVSAL